MLKGWRCPFTISPPKKEDTDHKEKIISFKQPIDSADPNGIKLNHNAKVCDSMFIEDILKHELQFTQLQDQMNFNNIVSRKAVYEATLLPSLQTSWRQVYIEPPVNTNLNAMDVLQFTNAKEQFVLKASDFTRSLAEDTRN